MAYELNKKIRDMTPYEPINGDYKIRLDANESFITPSEEMRSKIEKAVMEHPAVELCCAIGVTDETRINYAKVYVVLAEGYEASEKLTNEILAVCHKKLPEYMVPEEIVYRKDLPRTDRGKVDYRALEKEAEKLQ